MITHVRASLKMDLAVKRAEDYLKETGYIYPCLIVLKQGAPLDIQIEHPDLLDIAAEHDLNNPNEIYYTLLAFKKLELNNSKYFQQIANQIAKQYAPDAIGVVIYVLSKTFDAEMYKALPKDFKLSSDVESSNAIYTCYYLKDDPSIVHRILPYVNRGELPTAADVPTRYNILVFNTPWTRDTREIEPWFLNPFATWRKGVK